ncbi:hypothetical protein TWF694_009908 [Orbilia ellipsospora]|uniref:Uncharacterized protein n=1 Tax=Orbilia ellipsospora TaxID=2528407 RepID=A0AAV9XC93_9PEZI
MGCAPSKHDFGKKLKGGRKTELEIGCPTDFHRSSLSYPSALCVNCDLPSRTLLASLGNKDTSLCCNCDGGDQILNVKLDFKPLSPIASDATLTVSKRDLPTAYNFPFGFSHANRGYGEDCACPFDSYYGEYDDDNDSERSHKRYASFSSSTWKVEERVSVTPQEVVSCSRSNSYASSECLGSKFESSRHAETEPFIDDTASTLRSDSVGSKFRNRRKKLPFETFNQSSPDLLAASARKSQRVSKDQVKVIRIRGSKSTNWI